MTDVLCVFGTRPEAVKLVSVVEALRAAGLRTAVLATGQHTTLLDAGLLTRMGEGLALGVTSDGSILRFLAKARRELHAAFATIRPRAILVQGDTMSAFAAAQIAQEARIPVAHVEAGVRSHDLDDPWPEELIRVAIDRAATWRYAATPHAAQNLALEGFGSVVTGNTGIDELSVAPRDESSPTILVTLHRRELRQRRDAREVVQTVLDAIGAAPISAIWPVHPAMAPLFEGILVPTNASLCTPLDHATMLRVLSEARGVLTDSGGLVEEAATLGVPTAILRAANDRSEAVAAGIAQQFAPTPDGARLALQCLVKREIPRVPSRVYGDGHAAERIAAHLSAALAQLPAVTVA